MTFFHAPLSRLKKTVANSIESWGKGDKTFPPHLRRNASLDLNFQWSMLGPNYQVGKIHQSRMADVSRYVIPTLWLGRLGEAVFFFLYLLTPHCQVSSDQLTPSYLLQKGDEYTTQPYLLGIVISHDKDPYMNQSVFHMGCQPTVFGTLPQVAILLSAWSLLYCRAVRWNLGDCLRFAPPEHGAFGWRTILFISLSCLDVPGSY